MSLHVGTSGWSYKEWSPAVYPAGLAQADYLHHYATVFNAVEVNATAYRLQPVDVVGAWAVTVPADFRFVVRVHRRLITTATMAWNRSDLSFLARFRDTLAPLGDRLGALMLPVPPERERDDAGLDAVLRALGDDVPVAVDFRNASWFAPDVIARVAGHGCTVCVSETTGAVLDALPPGPLAYVRLRADHYSESARTGWHELLTRAAADRPVFAVARHEGLPPGDPHCGVGLAQWFVARASNR